LDSTLLRKAARPILNTGYFFATPTGRYSMQADRQQLIQSLFDAYIEMYASRDDRLTACFSESFSGYTGGGDFLVKDREA